MIWRVSHFWFSSSAYDGSGSVWCTICNVSIYNIEDLWLSFVVSYYYGWTIMRSFLPVNDYTNTVTQENALYLTLRNEKQVLLEYLQKTYKWIR